MHRTFRPLRAFRFDYIAPGLKPWAKSWSPVGAETRRGPHSAIRIPHFLPRNPHFTIFWFTFTSFRIIEAHNDL
jgi:hypothetical protein